MLPGTSGCKNADKEENMFGKLSSSNQAIADQLAELIVEKLDARDSEGLKKLFSAQSLTTIEDLDEQIDKLIEFYIGKEEG